VKIASWGGSRSGSGEPDRHYDIVVEWSDCARALAEVKNPFWRMAGQLRLEMADGYEVGKKLNSQFPADWNEAYLTRHREHSPQTIAVVVAESEMPVQWTVNCPCQWTDEVFSEIDAAKSVRSHLSPLREALEQCALAMALRLGVDFGTAKLVAELVIPAAPPEHQRVVSRRLAATTA
jgi:hypothetical protein